IETCDKFFVMNFAGLIMENLAIRPVHVFSIGQRERGTGMLAPRSAVCGIAGCCARAVSGHAPTALPSAASNSRRPMVTVIRPSRARCVKDNDTTPRACSLHGATGSGRPDRAVRGTDVMECRRCSLRLDAGEFDHLGPLFRFLRNEFS